MDANLTVEGYIYSEEIDNYFESDIYEDSEIRRYLVVIVYDVVCNKRRRKLVKFLNSYAVRVQKSAFEGILNKNKYIKLISEIGDYITSEDLLRVYKLTGNADLKIWGKVDETKYNDTIII